MDRSTSGDDQLCRYNKDHQQSKPELKELVRYSNRIVTCWKLVALELSLSAEDVDVIDVDHGDVIGKCYTIFNTWLKRTCDPCWCQVANALRIVNLDKDATEIEAKFAVTNTNVTKSVEPSEGIKRLSSIDEIEAEFGIMVAEIQEALENSDINVKKLLIKLKSSSAVRERKIPLFDKDTFNNITSIEKLFETLSNHWHLFDYDVLMYLVKTAGCKEAKRIYDNFLDSFDSSVMNNYRLILKCDEFKEGIIPGTCKLRIKVALDQCTVEIEKKVKEIISKHFELENYALVYKGLKQGCIELTYQISHSVKSYMLQYKLNGDAVLQLKVYKIIAIKFDCMEMNIPEDFSDKGNSLSWSASEIFGSYLRHNLNLLRENLKKWYRKLKCTRSLIEETIWSMFPTYPCIGYLSVFHDLSLHCNYISTLKLLSSVQELFEDANGHLKHILIEGHTGIGKTTLCKEICFQWAENNLFTPDKLVLLLLLQDPMAQKITSEYELAEYFTTSFDFIEPFSEYLISSCGAGVTIVIDSYDQLNEELQENGFIKDLMEGIRLSKAQIVITSTPFVSYHLHNCVDRRVEIFELAKSARDKFISEALKNFSEQLKKLQKHFLEYPKVDILSCVPINMAIMVFLDKRYTLKDLFTYSLIYDQFCDATMRLNMSFVRVERYNHEDTWFTLKYDAIKKLNCFAYVSLIKNKSVFLEEDLFDMCKKYPTCYGIMQSTECYSSAYHNKRTLFNFLCQGVQLNLAHRYIKKVSDRNSTIIAILKNCLATKALNLFYFMPTDWSMQVLNMCILGIEYEYANAEDLILKIIDSLDEDISSYNFHLRKSKRFKLMGQKSDISLDNDLSHKVSFTDKFDMDSELNKLIPKKEIETDSGYGSRESRLSITTIMLQYPPFLSLCLYPIFSAYFIRHNIVRDGKIDFTHYYLLPYHITSLGRYRLCRTNEFKAVDELHLGDCSIGDYGLYLLSCYLCIDTSHSRFFYDRVKLTINVINLHKNNLTAASSLIISKLINHLKPHSLELSCNNLTDAGLVKVSNAVIRNEVHVLNLAENGLTAQGMKSISLMMNILKVLDISHNNIGDQGAETLSQGLAHTMTLQHLELNHCNIGSLGASELARTLTINSSLEILWINGNAIGHNGAVDVAATLCINNTLKELSLTGDTTIGYSAASEILSSFHMSKTTALTKLFLPKTLCSKSLVTIKYNSIHDDMNKPRSIFFQ